jgi:hypothetical protein
MAFRFDVVIFTDVDQQQQQLRENTLEEYFVILRIPFADVVNCDVQQSNIWWVVEDTHPELLHILDFLQSRGHLLLTSTNNLEYVASVVPFMVRGSRIITKNMLTAAICKSSACTGVHYSVTQPDISIKLLNLHHNQQFIYNVEEMVEALRSTTTSEILNKNNDADTIVDNDKRNIKNKGMKTATKNMGGTEVTFIIHDEETEGSTKTNSLHNDIALIAHSITLHKFKYQYDIGLFTKFGDVEETIKYIKTMWYLSAPQIARIVE